MRRTRWRSRAPAGSTDRAGIRSGPTATAWTLRGWVGHTRGEGIAELAVLLGVLAVGLAAGLVLAHGAPRTTPAARVHQP